MPISKHPTPSREDFSSAVVQAVKDRIGSEPWFKGVCMDSVAKNYPDLHEAVEQAVDDTFYWDGLGFYDYI